MAVYQDRAKERIKRGLRRMKGIVERGVTEKYKEADTRKIVTEVLVKLLGWDEYENITAEQMINSRYADFVIRRDGNLIAVVEVKQIGIKLREVHLDQARFYAIDEGIDWVVLTDGDEWQVYRIVMKGKKPTTQHTFTVRISDDTMKPARKTELFYFMSEEAQRKHEIEDYYDRRIALSPTNLADHVLSEAVVDKIRRSIKASTGQRLANSEIAEALMMRLIQDDALTKDHERNLRKMQKAEAAKSKTKRAATAQPKEKAKDKAH